MIKAFILLLSLFSLTYSFGTRPAPPVLYACHVTNSLNEPVQVEVIYYDDNDKPDIVTETIQPDSTYFFGQKLVNKGTFQISKTIKTVCVRDERGESELATTRAPFQYVTSPKLDYNFAITFNSASQKYDLVQSLAS